VGKKAKKVNGMASATAKPSIPMAGANNEPVAETSTSKVPMIGPVHENDTNTKVKAINKMLRNPAVESAFASSFVDHEAGNVISKAPKNEMANTSNMAKKMRLNTALVDMLFRALAPKISVIRIPSATYINTMASPYRKASLRSRALLSERLRKKLTVIGMIGHTQGVNKARKPPKSPARKISQSAVCPVEPSVFPKALS
jgi:hypothetical protein